MARPNLPMLYDRIFSRPQLVHPATFSKVLFGLGSRFGIETSQIPMAMEDDDFWGGDEAKPQMEASVPGSVAVVGVHGVLVHRQGWLEGCGIRSYESLREDIQCALDDGNIETILLDIDSGGGECAGLFDFCDWIRKAQSQKPIYSFAHDHAYSAAYAIAASTSRIYIGQTGGVGSIGVVGAHIDESGMNQKAGIVITPIYAGAKKIDGWPHQALSESAKADWQYQIDDIYQKFVNHVAIGRKLNADTVRATEAGCFTAKDALSNGLADKIFSFDDVISEIFAEINSKDETLSANQKSGHSVRTNQTEKTRGESMLTLFKNNRAEKQPAASDIENPEDKEEIDDGVKEGDDTQPEGQSEPMDDDVSDADSEVENDDTEDDDKEEEKLKASRSAGYAEAMAVLETCLLNDKGGKTALSFLRKNMSAEEVRKKLLTAAKTSEKSDVTSQHLGGLADGQNRMIQKAQNLANKKGK